MALTVPIVLARAAQVAPWALVVVVSSGCVEADSPDPPGRLPPSRRFRWLGSQCLDLLYYRLIKNDFPLGSDGRERC